MSSDELDLCFDLYGHRTCHRHPDLSDQHNSWFVSDPDGCDSRVQRLDGNSQRNGWM